MHVLLKIVPLSYSYVATPLDTIVQFILLSYHFFFAAYYVSFDTLVDDMIAASGDYLDNTFETSVVSRHGEILSGAVTQKQVSLSLVVCNYLVGLLLAHYMY